MKYQELKKLATPLPWAVTESRTQGTMVVSQNGGQVFVGAEWLGDFQLATHCVNNFDRTLTMIKEMRVVLERSEPPSRLASEWEALLCASRDLIAEMEEVK